MKHLDLTLPSPEENLACDEALLDMCEEGLGEEVLRWWMPKQYFVVVGYANKVATEVNIGFCQSQGIPVLRRCTGGGTVLQGPGCLNYSLLLRFEHSGPLRSITSTNQFILKRHQVALGEALRAQVQIQGHTDLAISALKFSGNAQRRKRRFLIFHGSFLLDMDIALVEQVLPMPSWQPKYRSNRSHSDFLVNLRVPPALLRSALERAWNATEPFGTIPIARIMALVREKYAKSEWNLRW